MHVFRTEQLIKYSSLSFAGISLAIHIFFCVQECAMLLKTLLKQHTLHLYLKLYSSSGEMMRCLIGDLFVSRSLVRQEVCPREDECKTEKKVWAVIISKSNSSFILTFFLLRAIFSKQSFPVMPMCLLKLTLSSGEKRVSMWVQW